MLQIKPFIEHVSHCENCKRQVRNQRVLWQGIHVCVSTLCEHCNTEYIEDLQVGHATYNPYKIRLSDYQLFGNEGSIKWLGYPLRDSLRSPSVDLEVKMNVNVQARKSADKVVIVNCIDYLYGHSLLKLLNVQREYEQSGTGVIVIVQKALEWMVPEFVSEVWTVNIPFNKARCYYPALSERIQQELERFDEAYVSHAYSHPSLFDIRNFTGIPRYDQRESVPQPRITFIWREDRLWMNNYWISKIMQRFPAVRPYFKSLTYLQKYKVVRLFRKLRKNCPNYLFTITGLGKTGIFPEWICDERVESFNRDNEAHTCRIYSESEIVIGVHGSNMLLPSAHAKMTIDLMPLDRWGNYAQDILFQEPNNRLSSFKYRFVPIESSLSLLSRMISFQVNGFRHYARQMTEELGVGL